MEKTDTQCVHCGKEKQDHFTDEDDKRRTELMGALIRFKAIDPKDQIELSELNYKLSSVTTFLGIKPCKYESRSTHYARQNAEELVKVGQKLSESFKYARSIWKQNGSHVFEVMALNEFEAALKNSLPPKE